jgi:hypothetical protein
MDIVYGTPEQVAVVQRAIALWSLVSHDPRFAFQARTVSVAEEQDNTSELVISLCRLQGYASCHFVPGGNAAALVAEYEAAGLQPVVWNQNWGGEGAIAASREFLSGYQPPAGLTLKTVTVDTPDDTIRAICEASVRCGVMPPPGSAMRGHGPRGVMLYAEDDRGAVVGVGGGFMAYHPDSRRGREAFWGMLATDEVWRGKRLACWIGAQAILDLAERFDARGFSSGVKRDNPSSQAMCQRLGVGLSDFVYAGATDPSIMGDKPVTR